MAVETIVSIMESTAVVVAAVIAIRGINAWRREHVGRKRIDTAEEILEGFYQARDHIAHIRGITSSVGEGGSRKAGPDETADDKELLDRAFVPIERYRKHSDDFAKLRRLRYRARAYWGEAGEKPFESMEKAVGEVLAAAQTVAYYWRRQGTGHYPEGFDEHLRQKHALEAMIWARPADDPLKSVIEQMIKEAEDLCRPVIEGQER